MAKRVVLGKKGSDFVLQISKSGVDVIDDSPNTRDLLFNSLNNYRSGVIVSDTTITGAMSSSGVALPTTADSSAAAYIPAYQIIEKGVKSNFTQFQETTNLSFAGIQHTLSATVTAGLPTSAGGGMFELSLGGSGATVNLVKPVLLDITEVENPTGSVNGNYPYIESRNRGSGDGNVDILVLRIPCQYGKMTNNAALFGNSELTGVISGGTGSGGSPAAPTISSVSRIARDTTNDTVRVTASNGANNSGTITYAQTSANSAPSSGYQSSTDFTQPRNSTRYYWAKQGGVAVASGTQYDAAAVDTTPNAFTFTTKNSATAGQSYSQASTTIAGLADGDSAAVSVSGGTVNVSSVVNGGTVTATGTAAAAPAVGQNANSTVVTVTIGGVQGTFTINTPAPAADTTPTAFGNFTAVTASELSTVNTSNTITITGINAASAVSISGNGTFSIAGGAYTTSGNVTNGQTITVRLTSSGSYSTAVSTTLDVGGVTGSYSVTTRAAVAATTPTDLVFSQTSNTSGTSQTLSVTASGGSGTAQVSSNNSSWVSNGSSFSQNRNTTASYYGRNVGETNSASRQETFFIPPVVTLSGIGTFNESAPSKTASYDVNGQRAGGNFNTYSSYWGTVTTSISNNSGGWLTSSITNSSLGYFSLAQTANTTTSARSATVTYTTFTSFGYQHSMTFTYNQAGIAADTTPDSFTFTDYSGATVNTTYNSNITIAGINTATNATYSGDANGTFSIDNSTFNQTAKSVSNGTTIYLRLPSSGSGGTARTATITVGGVSDSMTVTTAASADSTPDAFNFTDVSNANATTFYTSSIIVAGINTTATATISGAATATFKVNSGAYSSSSKTVSNGDTVTARLRSGFESFDTQSATVTIGGVSDTWYVITGNTGFNP